jgi:hypothetical protein
MIEESFSNLDLDEVTELLTALKEENTTKIFKDYWYDEDVKPVMNNNSGYTFLTNSEYQAAMINDGKLDIFQNCSECGTEGFADEFDKTDECPGCKEIASLVEDQN